MSGLLEEVASLVRRVEALDEKLRRPGVKGFEPGKVRN